MNPAYSQFLNCVATQGCIERSRAIEIFQKIYFGLHQERTDEGDFNEAINTINSKISQFDQKIVEHHYTLPGNEKQYVIFVVTTESLVNQAQTAYSAGEAELFRLVMKNIITDDRGSLSLIDCINLVAHVKVKPISASKAEEAIKKWINQGYFCELGDQVYPGPRLITEFASQLLQYYKDYFSICNICREIVFWGPCCSDCQSMVHKHCMEKYLSHMNKCSVCKKDWNPAGGTTNLN